MIRLLLLSVSVLLVFPLVAVAQPDGRIEGVVVDVRTREVLSGANVLLQGQDVDQGQASGADGAFAFDVPQGSYRLEGLMIGYERGRLVDVIVEEGRTTTVTLALSETTLHLGEAVVTATRMSLPMSAISGAVTVLGEEEIRDQSSLSGGLGEMLGRLVPGLGVGTGSPSIYGQSLRGRTPSILIDGVPQSTTRNTSRDLTTIDPSMIERVEVVRGATAIYGDGATGGIINIITRRPSAAGINYTTELGVGGSLSAPGDGLESRITQTATGRAGDFDFSAGGTLTRTSGFYDAEGDLVPPDPYGQGGLASTTGISLLGRLGYSAGAHRAGVSFNHYDAQQETAWVTDPSVDQLPPGEQKARAMEGLHLDERQGSRNTQATLDYEYTELPGGGRLRAQVFYRDYLTRFSPFDGRAFATYLNIIQSFLDSEKFGARVEAEKTLHRATDLTLLAGIDYTDERTQQPVGIIDSTTFDKSQGLVYRTVGERPWVPLMNPRKTGLFAQIAWQPFDRLSLQGGVRYEPTRMHIDDFTTLIGNDVIGGAVDYDPVLFNAGAVVHLMQSAEVYAGFSQGFSLTDLGLLLRNAADGFVVGNHTLEAQTVDNFEAGVRAHSRVFRATFAGFYNTSDLGTTSAGLDRGVVRAPERVYGVEATLDVQPGSELAFGGAYAWTEGENDADEDGEYRALNSFRIQPAKLTGYVQHRTLPGWTNRLQVLYSAGRDRAYEERANVEVVGFGERPIESYFVVDFITSVEAGPGTIKAGINNLLNRQYYPVVSQLLYNGRNSSFAAAPGATLMLGYTVRY